MEAVQAEGMAEVTFGEAEVLETEGEAAEDVAVAGATGTGGAGGTEREGAYPVAGAAGAGEELRFDQRPAPPGVRRLACAEAAESKDPGDGLADPSLLVPYPAAKAAAEAVNVLLMFESPFQLVGNGGGAGGRGGGGGGCLRGRGCFSDCSAGVSSMFACCL
mmetsp:Transcript_47221/g.85050  ORF Transcript_47221/g.85050 Transcript_47221/m.85050 type:complete len:162 (-) Transcript_47221:411-896(-)